MPILLAGHTVPSSETAPKKKTTNFIEKNKERVSKMSRVSKPESSNHVVIRCLNEVDSNSNPLETSNNIDFDISIISNRSSIGNQKLQLDCKSPTNSSLFKFDSGLTKSQFDTDCEQDELLEYEQQEQKQQLGSCLVQGYQNISYVEGQPHDKSAYSESNDEVNIVAFDQHKSNVRSQFIKRQKRQVIPNLIECEPVEPDPPNLIDTAQEHHLLQQASMAASLAAMNAVSLPLTRIQSELECKINNVLTEIELLRRSNNYEEEHNTQQQQATTDEFLRKEAENQFRIKYLEQLQEKQFAMMSQLINVIGKENSNADLTVSSGRESLNKFRQQFESSQSASSKKNKPIRSRSRSGSNAKASVKKRSKSPGVRLSDMEFEPDYGCLECHVERKSRQTSPQYSGPKRQVRPDFLEELLDTCPKSPVSNLKLQSKSVPSFENNIYDNQPLLFDKYLHEAKKPKQIIRNYRQTSSFN